MKPKRAARKHGSKTPATAESPEELREPSSPVCYLREFDDLSTPAANVCIKRAYEPASRTDGARILIDRLWPRGVKRSSLAIDAWLKDVAPSAALRTWFHQDPEKRWPEFQKRYRAELRSRSEALQPLSEALRRGKLTLVYGARDPNHNHALILREFLLRNAGTDEK